MSELRIAFVRMAAHPIPNRLLPPALEAAFDGATLDVLDLEARVRRDRLSMLVNPAFVALEHGWSLLRGRIRPWRAFFTTTWMFRRMSALARHWIERGDFDLSFQIQSLFDARQPGTPHFVYTDHTHLANLGYPDFDRRTLRSRRWLSLERRLYANAALVFTRSHNISSSLVDDYGCPPDRVACVGAGSNARVPEEANVGERDVAPHILFVGADWERKGGPQLVQAFARLAQAHPGARLTIVGCRPEIDLPCVEVVGPVPVESVHRYYEKASIFCLPTHREPFGVALVEALHHGLPIVATNIGAVPDLVREGENGFLVDVGDVDALADRLEQLMAAPERSREMGERSRERARLGYTWPAVAERMRESVDKQLSEVRCR